MDTSLEMMLREALDAEPPSAADARIRAAIRFGAASRRRRRRARVLAAAAALVLLLGGGLWQYGRSRAHAVSREMAVMDEEEIMLEIIDMAEPVDLEAFQVAQL